MQLEIGFVFQQLNVQLQTAMQAALDGVMGISIHMNILNDLLQAIGQALAAIL